jgi:hypothetical protein
MILKEIKDLRVGQILKNEDSNNLYHIAGFQLISSENCLNRWHNEPWGFEGSSKWNIEHSKVYINTFKVPTKKKDQVGLEFRSVSLFERSTFDTGKFKLVGFLGITHKISDDGRYLVEIPRKEYEVDDIVEYEAHHKTFKYSIKKLIPYINAVELNNGTECYEYQCEKVGVLGVNYEFINEKLGE